MENKQARVNVAIIGAGVGGIMTAIALQSQLGFYDYSIYEMREGVGGTWLENTYPGCACDVPSHWYSLSTELNPDWSASYVGHEEIRQYWERLVRKHNIEPHIEYFQEVLSAVWDEHDQVYTITLQDVRTKEMRAVKANAVVSAVGVFHKPKFPDIPGQDRFGGVSMHARMWDHKVDFGDKRVAVIGNGCSATQIVPTLSDNPTTNIVNFCRTPSWFRTRPQAVFSEKTKRMFRNSPFLARLFRNYIAVQLDMAYLCWKTGPLGSFMRRRREKEAIRLIKSLAPEQYHDNLIPKFPMGCKRIVVNPGYLESLQRPNVELEFDSISEITEKGIITKSGKFYTFDIICYATGFDVEGSCSINIAGVGGKTMAEYFKQEGGPTAYMGTTMPGFPNWFFLLGPNTATGHASVIYSEEVQVNYAMQLLEPIVRGQAKSFAPKASATRAYNEWIQNELKRTVWTSCFSWYHASGENSSQGKLMTWPATQGYLWWLLRKPVWTEYETVGGEKWLERRKRLSVLKTVLEMIIAGAGLGAWLSIRTGRWDSFKHLIAGSIGKWIK
ncbi:4-hydroxyacetophenone monooxygenase [Ceratobasidium sp. AG-Ba]|nr:4-hydroxyacetophenone monooxygenase [Ceratobasidium sp. AG-Ba]